MPLQLLQTYPPYSFVFYRCNILTAAIPLQLLRYLYITQLFFFCFFLQMQHFENSNTSSITLDTSTLLICFSQTQHFNSILLQLLRTSLPYPIISITSDICTLPNCFLQKQLSTILTTAVHPYPTICFSNIFFI